MNHSRARREGGCLAGNAIVEARADVDQHIAVLDGAIDVHPAVHARHADAQRMVFGKRAYPVQRRHYRNACPLGERTQLGDGAGDDHAVTGKNEWLASVR